jgi:hypothetical protein
LYQGIASAMPQHQKIRAASAAEGIAALAAAKAGHLLCFFGMPEGKP